LFGYFSRHKYTNLVYNVHKVYKVHKVEEKDTYRLQLTAYHLPLNTARTCLPLAEGNPPTIWIPQPPIF
jgi:hypothetical protein